jgi:hypothetical protein
MNEQAKTESRACQCDQVSVALVMVRLLCRGRSGRVTTRRFRPGDASFKVVRPISYCAFLQGNY